MIEQLRKELRRFSTQSVFQLAVVVEVDKPKAICKVKLVENEAIELDNVRLQAIDNEQDNGILFFPKVDSSVIIGKLDYVDSYFVAMFSEVESVSWKLNGTERLKITASEIVFNEGTKGAMVEIAKLKSRLNDIETAFNQLLNHYKTHNHTHPQGPTTGLLVPSTQNDLGLTQTGDLANNAIKQ